MAEESASVMLGTKRGVGVRLKNGFPQILKWHCLNHLIELAVSNAIHSIDGGYHVQAFFNKVGLYSIIVFSQTPKKNCQNCIRIGIGTEKSG